MYTPKDEIDGIHRHDGEAVHKLIKCSTLERREKSKDSLKAKVYARDFVLPTET
jgi:hypothetical protein